jgi:hypothetical protein
MCQKEFSIIFVFLVKNIISKPIKQVNTNANIITILPLLISRLAHLLDFLTISVPSYHCQDLSNEPVTHLSHPLVISLPLSFF